MNTRTNQRPRQTASPASSFDWRRYQGIALTQINVLCGIILAVSLCATLAAFLLPKKYEASSTVFIEQNVISDLVKGIAITPSIESKLRILKVSLLSRGMLLGVLRELNMDLGLDTLTKQEDALDTLRGAIGIQHDERKGLFVITYDDKNPERARDFVNTLTRRYIEQSTSSKRKESIDATSFLAEQITMFQKRIEQAQHDIDAFKAEKGMYLGLNESLLRDQIRTLEQRLDELRIRKTECEGRLAFVGPSAQLRRTLEERELELQKLIGSYTERHPVVIRARESIKALSASIKAEEQKAAQKSDGLEYRKIKAELRSIEDMEASLTANIEKNTTYLQQLPEIRTGLAALEQRKDNEALIYEQLVSRYGQSEVSKQMELQDKSVSFNIIDAAVLPTTYTSPPRALIIIGGILLGVGIAGASIIARDLLRPKIRGRADLDALGLEVLATLPPLCALAPGTRRSYWRMPAITCVVLAMLLTVAAMEFFRLPYADSSFGLLRLKLEKII